MPNQGGSLYQLNYGAVLSVEDNWEPERHRCNRTIWVLFDQSIVVKINDHITYFNLLFFFFFFSPPPPPPPPFDPYFRNDQYPGDLRTKGDKVHFNLSTTNIMGEEICNEFY